MKKEIMVKVCSRCGIVNTEKAEDCESCGAELGEAVRNSEAKKLIKQISKRNEETKEAIASEKFGGADEKTPHIPVTPSRIIIGVLACLTAAAIIVLMVLTSLYPFRFAEEMFLADCGALILLAIAILYSFIPGAMWAFSHCTYRLYYKEMPEPSDTALVMQQISCVLLILLAGAVFGFHLAAYLGIL